MPIKLIPESTRYGRLVTTAEYEIRKLSNGKNAPFYKCICDCGNVTSVCSHWLRCGNTTSCGCYHRERLTASRRKYDKRTKDWDTYQIWCGIYSRCYNPNKTGYSYYGARGIKMAERWLGVNGFTNFLNDMGERPSAKHSVDRIDCDGDYRPANCRWVTIDVQARNKRPYIRRKCGPYKKETRRRRPKGYREMPDFNEEEWFKNAEENCRKINKA